MTRKRDGMKFMVPITGLRADRYNLIHYYQIEEWELFDLEADHNEMKSVYEDPVYLEIIEELKAELQRLQDKCQVPDKDPI